MQPNAATINLPHAYTIVGRLIYYLAHRDAPAGRATDLRDLLDDLEHFLRPFETDPPLPEALRAAATAAEKSRALVDEVVQAGYRGDRLGQCVRNLFECLGFPEEGAARSLVCGERPDSPLRP
jgi:hypothetical protein